MLHQWNQSLARADQQPAVPNQIVNRGNTIKRATSLCAFQKEPRYTPLSKPRSLLSIGWRLALESFTWLVIGVLRFASCFALSLSLSLSRSISPVHPRVPRPPPSRRGPRPKFEGPRPKFTSCGWACSRFPVFFSRARAPSHAFSILPCALLGPLGSRISELSGARSPKESGEARSLCLYNICFKAVADISLAVGARPLHRASSWLLAPCLARGS